MATPVSNTSVVNFRMPSAQASTSAMARVIMPPTLSCSSSGRDLWTRVLYSTCFMLRLTLLAKRRT